MQLCLGRRIVQSNGCLDVAKLPFLPLQGGQRQLALPPWLLHGTSHSERQVQTSIRQAQLRGESLHKGP